jgi:hypothetical protein
MSFSNRRFNGIRTATCNQPHQQVNPAWRHLTRHPGGCSHPQLGIPCPARRNRWQFPPKGLSVQVLIRYFHQETKAQSDGAQKASTPRLICEVRASIQVRQLHSAKKIAIKTAMLGA